MCLGLIQTASLTEPCQILSNLSAAVINGTESDSVCHKLMFCVV